MLLQQQREKQKAALKDEYQYRKMQAKGKGLRENQAEVAYQETEHYLLAENGEAVNKECLPSKEAEGVEATLPYLWCWLSAVVMQGQLLLTIFTYLFT